MRNQDLARYPCAFRAGVLRPTSSAAVLAATTMVLLGLKHPIHALTRRFTPEDIEATVRAAASLLKTL